MNVGYARCSTSDQNTQLQETALETAGCERIFVERGSGADKRRPELAAVLRKVSRGDTLVVWKLDRLARSMAHLVEITQELERRGVNFVSLTEAINTKTPGGMLVFHIFAAVAEFERELIRERVTAGVRAKIARDGYWTSRGKLYGVDVEAACEGLSVREAAAKLGVGRMTVSRALKAQRQAAEGNVENSAQVVGRT